MSTALVPVMNMQEMVYLAKTMAASKLFGITKPEEVLSLMAIAQAEGLHPAIAARDYHVIKGRPTLKADAMLARFQASGGTLEWHSYSDEKCEATISHPQGGTVRVMWDMARVKKAEIINADMYKKYPRNMLRARVISEGIRTVYPGVAVGVYTPEEAEDFADRTPKPEPIVMKSEPIKEEKAPEQKKTADPARPEPKAEAKPPPVATPEPPAEAVEVGPRTIPMPILPDNSGSDWVSWGSAYAAGVKSAKSKEEFDQWISKNSLLMGKASVDHPQVHAHLVAGFDGIRLGFAAQAAEAELEEIMHGDRDPLDIPPALDRRSAEAKQAELQSR